MGYMEAMKGNAREGLLADVQVDLLKNTIREQPKSVGKV
jgi:hypothetical protein